MKRTKIIIYPSPPWDEGLVDREIRLLKKSGTVDSKEASTDPEGWKVTVTREYPDA